MNQREPMNLALSATAEEYLQRTLPAFHKRASERGFVTSLKYSGRTGYVKDRTMVSAYHCREFVLCGEQPENLQSGEYHDLMGFQIWIGDLERDLLQGRQLTMIKVERPEPMELLGIENAPKGCFSQ